MKPVIGVTPLYDEGRQSIWMLPGYHELLLELGAIPVTLPFDAAPADVAQLLDVVDGVLFCGGDDIDPARYGAPRHPKTVEVSARRDELESALFAAAWARDLPLFGICRGIQLMNVLRGGTLWQDLPTERPSAVSHHMAAPYDRPEHEVEVVAGTPLADTLGAGAIGVNSCHHQAIRDLASGLAPMAVAPDGVIEAVWASGLTFAWAVQWHPEFSWRADARQVEIVRPFVAAAAAHRAARDGRRGGGGA